MTDIRPFLTMSLMTDIAARQAAGKPVFRFDLGEPARAAPEAARRAAVESILEGPGGYTPTAGRPELRARISRWYREAHGVEVGPERVIVTGGASAALILAILAGVPAGGEVILARPGYPAYRNQLIALGRRAREVECGPAEGFRFTRERLPSTPADAVLFASPANPTGAMLSPAEIEALVATARERGERVIADEIYHGLSYGAECWTAARHADVFVINSFSKFWRMTGWRLGWLVAPADLCGLCERLAQNLFLCPSASAQIAALVAMDAREDCEAEVARYATNRDCVLAALQALGVTRCAPAEGAFYIYADLSPLTQDTLALAQRLLAETGVAIAPGLDFDPEAGATWARFALTGEPQVVREGLARFTAWVRQAGRRG